MRLRFPVLHLGPTLVAWGLSLYGLHVYKSARNDDFIGLAFFIIQIALPALLLLNGLPAARRLAERARREEFCLASVPPKVLWRREFRPLVLWSLAPQTALLIPFIYLLGSPMRGFGIALHFFLITLAGGCATLIGLISAAATLCREGRWTRTSWSLAASGTIIGYGLLVIFVIWLFQSNNVREMFATARMGALVAAGVLVWSYVSQRSAVYEFE